MNRRDALAALAALPGVARIEVASLKPGDVIVLECDKPISDSTAEMLKAHLTEIWPDHKCIVLCDGLRLKVLSQ